VNAEKAYEALRVAYPSDKAPEEHKHGIGWGGEGLSVAPPPDWTAVENAPLPQLVDVIRPGGLAPRLRLVARWRGGVRATSTREPDERGARASEDETVIRERTPASDC